jgi:hypothetical protein
MHAGRVRHPASCYALRRDKSPFGLRRDESRCLVTGRIAHTLHQGSRLKPPKPCFG